MGGCLCKRKRSSSGRNRDRRQHSNINCGSGDSCNNAVQQVRRRLASRTQVVTLTTRTPSSQGVNGNRIIENSLFCVHILVLTVYSC